MNNPFRYTPSRELALEAENLIRDIDSDEKLRTLFSEGKMLGILKVEDTKGNTSYLHAFSGNVQGKNMVKGFVPPIFDLLDPKGYFKKEEAEITRIAREVKKFESSYRYRKLVTSTEKRIQELDNSLLQMKALTSEAKALRAELRSRLNQYPPEIAKKKEEEMIQQSQRQKADLKRFKIKIENEKNEVLSAFKQNTADLDSMRKEMASRSDALQRWIFEQFIVHNAEGEDKSILDVFKDQKIVPPGGTGECCAPKLLEYAYRHNLKPLEIGEFWYGKTLSMHISGNFYPACQGKCAPLLSFMLKGLDIEKDTNEYQWSIIYEDDYIIAVNKPSGLLSVPGKTGEASLLELVSEYKGIKLYSVHRLDMDTSGIILYAKSESIQSKMQTAFEGRGVQKVYKARLDYIRKDIPTIGIITLPIMEDYENRPLQKVSPEGKASETHYVISRINEDDTVEVTFYPKTGRTHQLRIHSAHPEGLGGPISGDKLYGSKTDCDLQLKAVKLSFIHPKTGQLLTLEI